MAAADDEDGEPDRSFFADRLAEHHHPWELPSTVVSYVDDAGPYELRVSVAIDPPDDAQVVELDECRGALDELEVLTGDLDRFDDLVDVLKVLRRSPATVADEVLTHFHLDRPPEDGWLGLVERLNVYGEALEFDIFERTGGDLGPWFRGELSWDHLLRIAAKLPAGSHYRAAMADDDELAARIAEEFGPPSKRRKSRRPPLVGFSTEVSYLHQITNQLNRLNWSVFAAQAEKAKRGSPPKPVKGPESADDRWEIADARREHDEVVSQVLVRRGGSKNRGGKAWVPKPEAVRGAVHLDPPSTD